MLWFFFWFKRHVIVRRSRRFLSPGGKVDIYFVLIVNARICYLMNHWSLMHEVFRKVSDFSSFQIENFEFESRSSKIRARKFRIKNRKFKIRARKFNFQESRCTVRLQIHYCFWSVAIIVDIFYEVLTSIYEMTYCRLIPFKCIKVV